MKEMKDGGVKVDHGAFAVSLLKERVHMKHLMEKIDTFFGITFEGKLHDTGKQVDYVQRKRHKYHCTCKLILKLIY